MPNARALHRWFGFSSSLVLVFVAGSGLALHIDRWQAAPPPEPGALAVAISAHDLAGSAAVLDRAQAALAQQGEGFVPTSVELSAGEGGVQVRFGQGGPLGPSLVYDDRSGLRRGPAPVDPGLHVALQDLHAGYLGGRAGELASFATGLALLLLGITGLVVYARLWRHRWRAGRRNPFWK